MFLAAVVVNPGAERVVGPDRRHTGGVGVDVLYYFRQRVGRAVVGRLVPLAVAGGRAAGSEDENEKRCTCHPERSEGSSPLAMTPCVRTHVKAITALH